MQFDRFSKILFFAVLIGSCVASLILFGMYSALHRTSFFLTIEDLVEKIKTDFKSVKEMSVVRPGNFLQPARYTGSGVTIDSVDDNGELVLLSGFFDNNNEIRLVRRNGDIVNRWPLIYSKVFKDMSFLPHPPATDWNVDTHGALALPDGSIVFNFEYSGSARIDRCGNVMWTLPVRSHHSVERAEAGGFWIPGIQVATDGGTDRYPPFEPPYAVSTLMHVSEDGEVLQEISAVKLFYDSGLESLLSSRPTYYTPAPAHMWNREILHLNKIAELSSALAADFPMFEAGDLVLSMRRLNLVMVVSPKTWKIRWWRIGPWLRQHDPEFRKGGTIVVFNNNIYANVAFGEDLGQTTGPTELTVPRISNVLAMDPASGSHSVLYGSRPGQEMLSVIRGKVDLTPENELLITESDGGRVFQVDENGEIVWEYINRYDDDEVAEVTEARVYGPDYFSVTDWSCDRLTSRFPGSAHNGD